MLNQPDSTLSFANYQSLLAAAHGMVRADFIYVGNDVFHPILIMPDLGVTVAIDDCALTVYRGREVWRSNPPLYAYGFRPDFIGGSTLKLWLMDLFRVPLAWFGRGPNRPDPWMSEHPIWQAKPIAADLLYQPTGVPEWNSLKAINEQGAAWLRAHEDYNGHLVIPTVRGAPITVGPPDLIVASRAAVIDGLRVEILR